MRLLDRRQLMGLPLLLAATPAEAADIGPEPPMPRVATMTADLVAGLARAGASELVVVQGHGQTGVLTAWRDIGAWQRQLGPWPVWLGLDGVAAPDHKVEGDLKTPTGVFGLPFAFGTVDLRGRTGLRVRRITGPWDVWVDDPTSPVYDRWVDRRTVPAAWTRNSESLPRYDRAVAILSNPQHIPYKGSAILIHVSRGRPTVGCVGVGTHRLDVLLRWLTATAIPHLAIGNDSDLTRMSGSAIG
jgi:L,D-peptidoglycan transpeptidase YkuD (ErfK/YbiS/YcfS/YnhG family)